MLTVQRALYGFLIGQVCLLLCMLFSPSQIAALFRRKRVYFPASVILVIVVLLFFQAQYSEYKREYSDLPSDVKVDSLEYVRWQKNRHRLERDVYLSLCCIISQAFLVSVSHWIDKYNRYVEYVDRQRKVE